MRIGIVRFNRGTVRFVFGSEYLAGYLPSKIAVSVGEYLPRRHFQERFRVSISSLNYAKIRLKFIFSSPFLIFKKAGSLKGDGGEYYK